jgi:anti-sigma factor RsiW
MTGPLSPSASHAIDLACKDVVELVTEYLSDAMTPEERASIEQHLLICPPCVTYLVQMKTTVQLAGGLDDAPAPAADPAASLALFQRWKQP